MSVVSLVRRKEVPVIWNPDAKYCLILFINKEGPLLQSTRGTHNPNLQVVITHASPYVAVWTSIKYERNAQNAIYHAHLNIESLVIWSRVFWLSLTWNLLKAQPWSKSA